MNVTLFGIMAAVGFILAGFILWRGAREEHLPEHEVFDLFVSASLWALVGARVAAIILAFDRFGWNPWRWLSVFHVPGLSGWGALGIGFLMVTIGAVRRGWILWLKSTRRWI